MQENKYETSIKELVTEFAKTIPNSENEKELIDSFEKYLYDLIETIQNDNTYIMEKNEENMKYILKYSTEVTKKLPLIQKKQKLIEDKNFEEIKKISLGAFRDVQKIISGEKIEKEEQELEEMRRKLKEHLNNVREFNKSQAQLLVSEGMLDIYFIENPKTELMSLRTGRYRRIIENN